jgi:hypothetical protein
MGKRGDISIFGNLTSVVTEKGAMETWKHAGCPQVRVI